jgi:DNA-binding NtrC family response regulator
MRTLTLEPILDTNPILVVDGEGTVLDSNLAWTKLMSIRRRPGLRAGLYDVVSFVGASAPPTGASVRDIQVHQVVLRDAEGEGPAPAGGEPINTALLFPIVHRRRDTWMVILLSPRLFHPDALRFAELLAMEAAAATGRESSSGRGDESHEDLGLTIELEGALRGALALAGLLAGRVPCPPAEIPDALLRQLREGIPGRRVVAAFRDLEGLGIPGGIFSAAPGSTGPPVRLPITGWHAPGRTETEPVAAADVALEALPAWLQRAFADSAPEASPPRFLRVPVPLATGHALLAAGPWRGTEVTAPDERLLLEMAGLLLAHRIAGTGRERSLEEEARRLGHALRAERTGSGRVVAGEPVALSAAMAAALERGRSLEALGRPYVVRGAAGSGRRSLARYLISIGPRAEAPRVEVGCRFQDEASLREALFGDPEDEARGEGAVDLAAGGTLLVSDLEAMPPALQARLLDRLRRPPAPDAPSPPVVVATTSASPERWAQAGTLHPDLAALFGARGIAVPPLSERPEDLVPLASRLAEAAAAELGRPAPALAPSAADRLRALPWPGHVRELRAAIEGAVALAADGPIEARHLPGGAEAPRPEPDDAPPPIDLSVGFTELKQRWIDHFERAYLAAALARCDGNLTAAARLAGIDKKNFHGKATRLGLGGRHPEPRRLKRTAVRRSIEPTPGDGKPGEGEEP